MKPIRRLVLVLLPLVFPLLGTHPEVAPPDPGAVCQPTRDCRKACSADARLVRRECRDAGGSREECIARAQAYRQACYVSECRPMPSCEDDCRVDAAALHADCLAAGGSAADCQDDAETARVACERRCRHCPPEVQCTAEYAPVCGEDGKTYSNGCQATCAGVEIVGPGACIPDHCEPVSCRLFCEHGFARDETGCEICRCAPPHPCLIRLEDDPVCGADGKTYRNDSFAICAGVVIVHEGPCVDPCGPRIILPGQPIPICEPLPIPLPLPWPGPHGPGGVTLETAPVPPLILPGN